MSDHIWKQVFFGLAAAMVVLAGGLLLAGKPIEATIAVVAAALVLIATRLRDLLKIKVSKDGLEAELREVIEEARVTVAELHLLASETARVILDNDQASGRWGGRSKKDKEASRQSIVATLRKLKVPEATIADIVSVQDRYVLFDYAHWVTKDLGQRLDETKKKAWNAFFENSKHGGIGAEHSPDELEAFLTQIGVVDEDVAAKLADYRHYQKTKQHRRPEVWFNG